MRVAALILLCLGGACTDPPPAFTYSLAVDRSFGPVAINGDAQFTNQTWSFESYAEGRASLVIDVTYGQPPQQGELRPGGCELHDSPYGAHDTDRLELQRVTVGRTPSDLVALWCQADTGDAWGYTF